jgi:hypothetical protein
MVDARHLTDLHAEDLNSCMLPLLRPPCKSIDHLLISCVYVQLFWFILWNARIQIHCPQLGENSCDDWWARVEGLVGSQVWKGLTSITILGAWLIWKHRNRCVFDGPVPNIVGVSWLKRNIYSCSHDAHF